MVDESNIGQNLFFLVNNTIILGKLTSIIPVIDFTEQIHNKQDVQCRYMFESKDFLGTDKHFVTDPACIFTSFNELIELLRAKEIEPLFAYSVVSTFIDSHMNTITMSQKEKENAIEVDANLIDPTDTSYPYDIEDEDAEGIDWFK